MTSTNAIFRPLGGFFRWVRARPIRVGGARNDVGAGHGGLQFFQTGPDLVQRIVRAIELGQSVVLSGPRGSGKSHCIRKAIEAAEEKGVIAKGAWTFLQGNKEIPRDYLVEDEITFRVRTTANGDEVFPFKKSAPLFKFAIRNPKTREPDTERDARNERTNVVKLELPDGEPMKPMKFVLFLDEVNRFSDGVLDSLLSVLEEGTAVLAGDEYKLPVVVCMTMNPPGYDSSARKLSPPLAARIGRSYRLYSPDIDTLADLIIQGKVNGLRARYEDKGLFPEIPPDLRRRVALVTLCLWGDVTSDKSGNEYLTPETRRALASLMASNGELRDTMRQISGLCHFGPDGRAAGDWLATAIGRSIDRAKAADLKEVKLTPLALRETAIESVAHKIYDNFSPASRPDLTRAKERAILTVTRIVLESTEPALLDIVERDVDKPDKVGQRFGDAVWGVGNGTEKEWKEISDLLVGAGLTSDEEIDAWVEAAGFSKGNEFEAFKKWLLTTKQHGRPLVVSAEAARELKPGYSSEANNQFAEKLVETGWNGSLCKHLKALRESLGHVRMPIREELTEYDVVVDIGVDRFLQLCSGATGALTATQIRAIAAASRRIWVAHPDSDDDAHKEATSIRDALNTAAGIDTVKPCLVEKILPELRAEALRRRGRAAHASVTLIEALESQLK